MARRPRGRDGAHNRPDFQRLFRAVQAGQADTIVAQTLDRFGVKDAYEMGKFFSILRDHDCRLVDAAGKQLNADDDVMVRRDHRRLHVVQGAEEKATRVLTGKMAREQGQLPGRIRPSGWMLLLSTPRATRCGSTDGN